MKSVIDSGPGPLIHRSRSRPFLQAMAATNRARHPSGSRSGDGNEDTGLLRQLRFLARTGNLLHLCHCYRSREITGYKINGNS